jgi:hypothetical protein
MGMKMGKFCLLSRQFSAENEKRPFAWFNTKNNAMHLSHSNAPIPPTINVDNVTKEDGVQPPPKYSDTES